MRLMLSLACICILLAGCAAPAATPTPTVPPIPSETISPTPAPSATPSLAPEPTATPTPESREFEPPVEAGFIQFEENLQKYELELAPDADKEAIYYDIAISHLASFTSKSIPENRAVYEQVIAQHPEWDGITNSWDYEIRKEFVTAFLEESGGKAIISDMNFQKHEADFNLPIKFEVVEVDKLDSSYKGTRGVNAQDIAATGGGVKMHTEDGQLIYQIAITQRAIDFALTQGIRANYSWDVDKFISEMIAQGINVAARSGLWFERPVSNYKLYIAGSNKNQDILQPAGDGYRPLYFGSVKWTFLKIIK